MLALERKATILKDGSVYICAQPFGGGVRILRSDLLKEMLGEIQFDSERSKQEQDFRILIRSSQWDAVKRYCLSHLENPDDSELESTPDRELVEEFGESMRIKLKPDQYTVRPMGFVIEEHPVKTENWHARGFPTVRIYYTYTIDLVDRVLCKTILAASEQISDSELGKQALESGTGRANSALVLPLDLVKETYLALSPEMRYGKIKVEGHILDESVLAVLMGVDVPQYQRMKK